MVGAVLDRLGGERVRLIVGLKAEMRSPIYELQLAFPRSAMPFSPTSDGSEIRSQQSLSGETEVVGSGGPSAPSE